ncbi:hypothetical protein EDC04DRAFT_2790121 [Pisolithus marmoratus]|nr:hypothetical protein EDC04DRAFT_2790121 [Pisolithus marmoratus]
MIKLTCGGLCSMQAHAHRNIACGLMLELRSKRNSQLSDTLHISGLAKRGRYVRPLVPTAFLRPLDNGACSLGKTLAVCFISLLESFHTLCIQSCRHPTSYIPPRPCADAFSLYLRRLPPTSQTRISSSSFSATYCYLLLRYAILPGVRQRTMTDSTRVLSRHGG